MNLYPAPLLNTDSSILGSDEWSWHGIHWIIQVPQLSVNDAQENRWDKCRGRDKGGIQGFWFGETCNSSITMI